MTADRCQKAEDRGQMSGFRCQKADVKDQMCEVGFRFPECGKKEVENRKGKELNTG